MHGGIEVFCAVFIKRLCSRALHRRQIACITNVDWIHLEHATSPTCCAAMQATFRTLPSLKTVRRARLQRALHALSASVTCWHQLSGRLLSCLPPASVVLCMRQNLCTGMGTCRPAGPRRRAGARCASLRCASWQLAHCLRCMSLLALHRAARPHAPCFLDSQAALCLCLQVRRRDRTDATDDISAASRCILAKQRGSNQSDHVRYTRVV